MRAMLGWTIGIGRSGDQTGPRKYMVVLFGHFFLLGRILFFLFFVPVMGWEHFDGGTSTALSPALLCGQGMGFIV